MNKSLIDALAERVERLERENRYLRRMGAVVLIGALVLLGGGAYLADGPKTVEAKEFVLRDRDGKERLEMFVGPDGTPRHWGLGP